MQSPSQLSASAATDRIVRNQASSGISLGLKIFFTTLVVLSASQFGYAALQELFAFGDLPSPQINNGASWGDEVTAYQTTMTTFGFKVHSPP